MRQFYNVLDKVLATLLMLLLVLMVVSITSEIVLREIVQPILQRAFTNPPAWISEFSGPLNTLSQVLLVWVGILGSALALKLRAHIGVDVLVRLYPRRVQLVFDYVSTALVAIFSLGVLLYGGYRVCATAFAYGYGMPGFAALNRGWFYLVLPIAGVLGLIYCVYHARHPVTVTESPADEIRESVS